MPMRRDLVLAIDGRIVEQVMTKNNNKSYDKNNIVRQVYHHSEDDHAYAYGPDHLEYYGIVERVKCPAECYYDYFNNDQPDSSFYQKTA